MANSSLSVFEFQSNRVRVVSIDGEPWFVLADVLSAIESKTRPSDARSALQEDLGEEVVTNYSLETNGGTQTVLISNDMAVTFLLSRSRTDAGKQLNRWIHKEVLPSIRKTGSYSIAAPEHQIPRTYAEALLEAGRLALENEKLSAKIEKDAPLVAYAEAVQYSEDSIEFNAFAKMIGTGRTRLFG